MACVREELPLRFFPMGVDVGYHRHYEQPFRVKIWSLPSKREIATLLSLPGVSPDIPGPAQLHRLIHDGAATVLVATADFTLRTESVQDSGMPSAIVGGLIAPVFLGEKLAEDDPDCGKFGGANMCQIHAIPVASDVNTHENDDTVTQVRTRLLHHLLKTRRDLAIDVIRMVVEPHDTNSLGLLECAGFRPGNKSDQ